MNSVNIFVPGIVTKNRTNTREHWRKIAARSRSHKGAVGLILSTVKRKPKLPARVTLVRCGGRKMDTDGLASALKDVRDAVATWLGADDGSDLFDWHVGQEKGKVGVRIEIVSIGPEDKMDTPKRHDSRETSINLFRDSIQQTLTRLMHAERMSTSDLALKLGIKKSEVLNALEMQDWNPTLMRIATLFYEVGYDIKICYVPIFFKVQK
jgi:hypothetical protein